MIRDKKAFDREAFDKEFDFWSRKVEEYDSCLTRYRPLRDLLLMKYTKGDDFEDLTRYCERVIQDLHCYKQEKLKNGIPRLLDFKYLERDVYPLLAFAYALPVARETWETLTGIYPEGRDYITDRVIATRNPQRKIADFNRWPETAPAHYKYFRLLGEALHTDDEEERIKLTNKQLRKWRNKGWRGTVSIGSDPDLPKNPAYYGQFAYEVALAVMAFDIDDSSFREDIYYPKELVEYYREREPGK